MGNLKSYTGGRFMLELDGEHAGFIKSAKGGTIKGQVVTHNLGTSNIKKKHLATIEHSPFTFEVGMGMGKSLSDWIKQSFDFQVATRSGAIYACDADYKVMAIREFYDALITKITFPKLDGADKNAGYFTIEMKPRIIRYAKGTGDTIKAKIAPKTKAWLNSNFRVTLGNLPCRRVASIESFTFEQNVVMDQVGLYREPEIIPADLTVPDLSMTISMADYEPWADWHKSFVIDGNCTDEDELTGEIEFLSPDLKETLGSLSLTHVGIHSLEQEPSEANSPRVGRFKVGLYCEEMAWTNNYCDL